MKLWVDGWITLLESENLYKYALKFTITNAGCPEGTATNWGCWTVTTWGCWTTTGWWWWCCASTAHSSTAANRPLPCWLKSFFYRSHGEITYTAELTPAWWRRNFLYPASVTQESGTEMHATISPDQRNPFAEKGYIEFLKNKESDKLISSGIDQEVF